MKPPVLTSMSALTRFGQVMASLAAANPPTELPIRTAGGRSSAVTKSSRASAIAIALGFVVELVVEPLDAPCQGQSSEIV